MCVKSAITAIDDPAVNDYETTQKEITLSVHYVH